MQTVRSETVSWFLKREIGSRVGSCAVIEAKVNPGVSFQHPPWVAHYRGRSTFARETVSIFLVNTPLDGTESI
jgi:hypothetical protein